MESSTPNTRRKPNRALLGDTPQFTPLKIKGRFAPTDPDILSESNDDLERAERRKSRALRKSIVSLPHSTEANANRQSGVTASESPALNDSVMRLSDADLKTQLNTFCKLSAENKISTKNAWHIRVIDVLKQIVSKDNTDVLKVAGTSLIVAAKVYGLRVDDLHAESLKLAASLGRNFANRDKDDDGNDEQTSQTAEEGQKKKSERRKKRILLHDNKKLTIEPDSSSFLGPLPKLESNFFSTKTESGLSATDNLSTNKCRMDPSGCRFLFGTTDKVSQWTAGSDKSVNLNKTIPITLKPIKTSMLCAQLKDFQTDNWNPNQEYDESYKIRTELEDVVQDENGFPIAEIDGSLHDVFNEPDNQDADGSVVEENAVGLIRQDLEYIVNFVPTESHLSSRADTSLFSFNDVIDTRFGKIEKMWAGPSHWKLKLLKPRTSAYSGKDENVQKVPLRKKSNKKCEPEYIDMWKIYQEELNRTEDVPENHKKFSCKKFSVSDQNKVNLPLQDRLCRDIIENIDYLMTVPTKRIVKKKPDAVECSVTGYNYDNPNDSNYCPQPNADDDNGADCLERSGRSSSPQAFTGDNLVEAPEMVEQIFTKYATKAKKMNMAKLKEFTWCILTGKEIFNPSAKVLPIHFSKMYSDLPKILPENMANELSCHLSFVALLHLCNEHNLELRKQNDISDFEILGP
uniref:Condensin complex subunit 2 n=1 Tax=Dendroctonus ponderosae TaxID=77166 RepID=A0AAR5P1K4_DENPD